MILRNTLFVLVFALTVGFPALSQGIYGLKQNVLDPFTEGLLLARFDMELGAWRNTTPSDLPRRLRWGAGTFDNVSGQYVFVGAPLGGGPLEWYNYLTPRATPSRWGGVGGLCPQPAPRHAA